MLLSGDVARAVAGDHVVLEVANGVATTTATTTTVNDCDATMATKATTTMARIPLPTRYRTSRYPPAVRVARSLVR